MSRAAPTLRPADVTFSRVVALVAGAVLPLLCLLAALVAGAALWWAGAGDPVLLRMATGLLAFTVLGVVGSFAVHEFAHVVVLRGAHGVTAVSVERTLWRVSVVPHGSLTVGRALAVAVAGPAACAVLGAGLWAVPGARAVAWCHLAHLVFLTPVFGDGRVALRALRQAGRAHAGGQPAPTLGPWRSASRASSSTSPTTSGGRCSRPR